MRSDTKSQQVSHGACQHSKGKEGRGSVKGKDRDRDARATRQGYLRVRENKEWHPERNQQCQCEREVSKTSIKESIMFGRSGLEIIGSEE